MDALEGLISRHKEELTAIYTTLSPNPNYIVESKLRALHEQLTATVEKQTNEARDELTKTEEHVEQLRAEVVGISECLGQRELVATDPAETLTEKRERLSQTVATLKSTLKTRVAQFRSVQQKLHSFIPLLDSSYFAPDLEIGDPTYSSSDDIPWQGRSYTLSMLERLKQEITRCTQEVEHRSAFLHTDLSEILTLWSELELSPCTMDPQCSDGNAPPYPITREEIEFDEAIMAHLGVPEGRELKPMLCSRENVEKAKERRTWLEREKERRESLIQSLFDQLHPLWCRLGVSEEESDQFMEANKGVGGDSIQAYIRELERMLQKKAENMEIFIKREREDITLLWDQLFYGQNQRNSWSLFYSTSYTEEVLQAHELEKERLQEEVADKETILRTLNKYFSVLADADELEASAQDTSRLMGKSTRGDPGRLLREEKARKRVQKEKPKLEIELTVGIPLWEESRQQPFLVNGGRFLDDLRDRLEKEAAKKGAKKQSKGSGLIASTPVSLKPQRTGGNAGPLKAQKTGDRSVPQSLKRQVTGTEPPSTTHKRTRTLSVTTPASSRLTKPQALNESINGRNTALSSSVGMGFPISNHIVRLPAGWGQHQSHQSQHLDCMQTPTPAHFQQQSLFQSQRNSNFPYRPSTASSISGSVSSSSVFSHHTSRTVSSSGTSIFSEKDFG